MTKCTPEAASILAPRPVSSRILALQPIVLRHARRQAYRMITGVAIFTPQLRHQKFSSVPLCKVARKEVPYYNNHVCIIGVGDDPNRTPR